MGNHMKLVAIGLLAGIINGLIGIGGGTILIPAMVLLFAVKQHQAHGTSLAVVLPTTVVSTFIYYMKGYLDWRLIIMVSIGSTVGGYLGAKLMNKIPSKLLNKIFAVFMIIAGSGMILR